MNIHKVYALYFSPAGTTRRMVTTLANALAESFGVSLETVDITLPAAREGMQAFADGDLVVCGSPTYAGKLPNKLLPYWKERVKGNGALAVALVTFGNRAFDNSLAELCACLADDGFHTVGAGAFACRHVFSETLAEGRPDADDFAELAKLGAAVATRVAKANELPAPPAVPGDAAAPYYTPLGMDGAPKNFLKAKPKTSDACVQCGVCAALCPMGSIDPNDVSNVTGVCIKCHACVRECPMGAKFFDDEAFLSHKAMLEHNYERRAKDEWFT
ncbi:MAG: ferredoxin family protein [Ruminococcaceae bacterium]|jgi:NAD-dependent dihydropyrimidine dehydrogenase PreA subunit/flavodoxin|nr:ferredoxin family protein [Oscillospiraceae bacterium]